MFRKFAMRAFNLKDGKEVDEQIKRLEKIIEDYRKLGEIASEVTDKASYRNFTTIDSYDVNDESYQKALKEIYESKEFMFFVDLHKNHCIRDIMDGDNVKGLEMQGILKGIDYIMANLYMAKKKYLIKKEEAEEKENSES